MTRVSFALQILYGLLLLRRKEYIDHPITWRFHVRVLIPCYSESLEIVSATALAARRAALPAGVRRTGKLDVTLKDMQCVVVSVVSACYIDSLTASHDMHCPFVRVLIFL